MMRYFTIHWSENDNAVVMYVKSKNVVPFSKSMYHSKWPYQLPPAEKEIVQMAVKAGAIDSNEADNIIRVDELIPELHKFDLNDNQFKEI